MQPITNQCCLQALGCGPADYEGHVKALVAGKKDSIKEKKSLMDELAGLHGRELAHHADQQGTTATSCCKDTQCEHILVVRTMRLGTKHCLLTVMAPVSNDNPMQGQFSW